MTNTRSTSSVSLLEVSVVVVLVVVGGRGSCGGGGLSAHCRSALSQQRSDGRRPV